MELPSARKAAMSVKSRPISFASRERRRLDEKVAADNGLITRKGTAMGVEEARPGPVPLTSAGGGGAG